MGALVCSWGGPDRCEEAAAARVCYKSGTQWLSLLPLQVAFSLAWDGWRRRQDAVSGAGDGGRPAGTAVVPVRSSIGLLGVGWRPIGRHRWRQGRQLAAGVGNATPGSLLAAGRGKTGAPPFASIPPTMLVAAVLLLRQNNAC